MPRFAVEEEMMSGLQLCAQLLFPTTHAMATTSAVHHAYPSQRFRMLCGVPYTYLGVEGHIVDVHGGRCGARPTGTIRRSTQHATQ